LCQFNDLTQKIRAFNHYFTLSEHIELVRSLTLLSDTVEGLRPISSFKGGNVITLSVFGEQQREIEQQLSSAHVSYRIISDTVNELDPLKVQLQIKEQG
jgi:hypothetical protein